MGRPLYQSPIELAHSTLAGAKQATPVYRALTGEINGAMRRESTEGTIRREAACLTAKYSRRRASLKTQRLLNTVSRAGGWRWQLRAEFPGFGEKVPEFQECGLDLFRGLQTGQAIFQHVVWYVMPSGRLEHHVPGES